MDENQTQTAGTATQNSGEMKSPQDTEKQEQSSTSTSTSATLPSPKVDPWLVTWDGPDDPANPKNWTYRKKWCITIVVSTYTFISPISTSIVAPALLKIAPDLHIHSFFVASLTLSIFILAYGFGPFVIGPSSEIYGRVTVLQIANLFYLVFNTACGFAKNTRQLIAFRFLAGIGGR